MQKLETINKTEILTESEKKETTWTDKSGKKHPATQVKGDKYTGKEADSNEPGRKSDEDGPKSKYKKYPVPDKEIDESFMFKGAIAQALVEEFGYEVEESTLTENPHASDPAKSAAWAALSPEDQKWLGGADPTDPAILARAPNKGKPAATAPGAGTKPAAPAAPIGTTAQGDDAGNTMITKPDGTVQVVGPDGNVIPPGGGRETPPGGATPAAVDPAVAATREKFKALMDKLEKTGGVSGSAPAPKPTQIAPAPKKPATGASTKPSQPLPGVTGVPGAQISNTPAAESVTYEDDQILLAIKNVRF